MKKCLTLVTLFTMASASAADASQWQIENDDQTVKIETNGLSVASAPLQFVLSTSDCGTARVMFAGLSREPGAFERTDHMVWINDTYPIKARLLASEFRANHRTKGLFEVGSYQIDGPYLNREFGVITMTTSALVSNSWSGDGLRQALKDAEVQCRAIL